MSIRFLLACWAISGAARPDAAAAWQYLTASSGLGNSAARSLALDPSGDVIAGGNLGGNHTVVKLRRNSGSEIWRHVFSNYSGPVTNVAVDADGNVLGAGWADDKTTSGPGDARLTVFKLDPDGQLLWQSEIDAGGGTPFSGIATPVGLVVDASGNPIVAALMTFTVNMDLNDAWIIKLSGSDGSETWRYIKLDKSMTDIALAGSDVAAVGLRWVARVDGGTGMLSWEKDVPDTYFWTVTVDPAGDIVAGASDNDFSTGGAVAVRKFAGANGDTLWTYPAPGPTHVVFRVRTDPSGNVGVAGTNGTGSLPGNHPFVARLSGATGTQLFLTNFSGTDAGTVLDFTHGHPLARHIGFDVDGAGNGYLACYSNSAIDTNIGVFKISTTGADVWDEVLGGAPQPAYDDPEDLLFDGGDVLFAGDIDNDKDHFFVASLSPDTGQCTGFGCFASLNTGVIKAVHKFEKKWLWGIAATGNPLLAPPPATEDDPAKAGATVDIANPVTRESTRFVLPPGGNWEHLIRRRDGAVIGYRYEDRDGRNGPCRAFSMTTGKRLTLTCKANEAAAPFTLDEASQGALNVHIQIGSHPYCLSTVGGKVEQDEGGALRGSPGRFKVTNAPPPDTCN